MPPACAPHNPAPGCPAPCPPGPLLAPHPRDPVTVTRCLDRARENRLSTRPKCGGFPGSPEPVPAAFPRLRPRPQRHRLLLITKMMTKSSAPAILKGLQDMERPVACLLASGHALEMWMGGTLPRNQHPQILVLLPLDLYLVTLTLSL